MAVKLDFLQSNIPSTTPPAEAAPSYLYKDLKLDLTVDYTRSDELLKTQEVKDIQAIYDHKAVAQSLRNLFQTLPGQKILNPTFGVDLRRYLFSPVNRRVAYIVGLDLLETVPVMEPRVNILNIEVTPDPEPNEYIVNLIYNVPSLLKRNVNTSQLKLTLNKNGFQII